MYSISLSMSSRTIRLRLDLYASSNTFTISATFVKSALPTNYSGDIILTNKKSDSIASFAANAVLPEPLTPSINTVSNEVL
jgi:hypothetical protein